MKEEDAGTPLPPNDLRQKPKLRPALLLLLLVGVCGLWLGSRRQGNLQAEETASVLAEHRRSGPCGVESVRPSLKALTELTERWSDELAIAGTVPRYAMGGPFGELLRTRRELEDLAVAPCLAVARHYRKEEMSASITLFRGLMAESIVSPVVFQTAAAGARRESEKRILALRERLYPADVAREAAREKAAVARAERERAAREAEQTEALLRRTEAEEEAQRLAEEATLQERVLRQLSTEELEQEQEERAREVQATLQRNWEEMRRRNEETARQNRIAREEKMASWGVAYAEHIQPVKAALQEILQASQARESVALLKACGRLHTAVGDLKAGTGRVPDNAAQVQFQSVLTRLDRVGESCALKSTAAIHLAMEDLEGSMKGLGEALRPYNLSP
jgi:hypothetical protein